jgi:threonine dehydrogenase-like Zn-dependent dehydrogenase
MHAVKRATSSSGMSRSSRLRTLGLGMVAYAKEITGGVVAIDLSDDRLERARKLGATHTLNPRTQDVVGEVKAMTEGYGCDVYIEATGIRLGRAGSAGDTQSRYVCRILGHARAGDNRLGPLSGHKELI